MHRYVGKGRGGRKGFHKRGLLFALSETVVHFCVHPHTGTYIYMYIVSLWKGEQVTHATGNGTLSLHLLER